jgi:hypothetical protein
LLGWAGGTLAISAGLLAIADILGLVDSFEANQISGFRIAAACKILLDFALVPAFAVSWSAFLSHGEERARRLEVAATLAAAGATFGVVGAVIATGAGIAHELPETYIASLGAVVAARFISVFAALSASSAFSKVRPLSDSALTKRDQRLTWASGGLACSYVLAMISQLFLISYASARGASGGFVVGVSVEAFGAAIAAGAGLVGGITFYSCRQLQRRGQDGVPQRDARLGVATAVFTLAFLLMSLGVVLQAVAERGLDARITVLFLLTGVSLLGNAIASAFATAGFRAFYWE